jgi:hypothetical protein
MENFLDTVLGRDEKEIEQIVDKISFLDGYALLSYADTILPNWILHKSKHYIPEYSNLEQNWYQLCQRWNTEPKHILMVQCIPPQSEIYQYTILHTFCNLMTKSGFVIRTQSQVIPCRKCQRMMLSEPVWRYLKMQHDRHPNAQVQQPIPKSWNEICHACDPTIA